MKTNPLLLLAAAGPCLLSACKPPTPPQKITATDTGKDGAGAQTIKGGNITLSLSADGKPVSYTIGNDTNLLRQGDFGPGFFMTTGTGAEQKTIPFVSSESKDGKLILTAGDKTRVTLGVNAGDRFISLRLEKIEDVPKGTEPTLNFVMNFQPKIYPELVPFDYMCLTGGIHETSRFYCKATWPYLWQRGENDPLGGFALFVPQNDEEHNEALLRIWTEEKVPHPYIEGEWTYHAGEGTLAIQGEVKSGHYLWYQGGDKVGVYDKNWNLQNDLPVVATNYEVDKGFSEFWIDGECGAPPPWLDVQFITKGDTIKVANTPPAAPAK